MIGRGEFGRTQAASSFQQGRVKAVGDVVQVVECAGLEGAALSYQGAEEGVFAA